MNLLVDIALAHLKGRVRQTIVSISGVALGVGFSVAMAALMEGSQRDFVDKLVNTTPHVVIKDEYRYPPEQPAERAFPEGAIALSGVKPKEELRGIRNAKARMVEIDKLPGVAAAPTLTGQAVIRYGGKDVAGTIVGIDTARERRVSNLEDDLIAGSLRALHTAANGIIIGTGMADRLGAGPGDLLSVSSAAGTPLKMTVVGIFRTGIVAVDELRTYALIKKVQILGNRPNVINEIRLRLDDPNRARDVAARVERRIGYRSESWQESNESILEVFVVRNAIMYTVVGAILVVAAFGIFNIVSTIIFEKARDIAILKSLGFSERDIRVIFLSEGLALGALGSGLGWALGFGLCQALGTVTFQLRGLVDVTRLPLAYEPSHYAIAASFALGAAALAGYLPARRAARLHPVEIIRGAA